MILSRTPLTLSFLCDTVGEASAQAGGVHLSAAITRYVDVQCRFRASDCPPNLRLADYGRPASSAERAAAKADAARQLLRVARDVEVCRYDDALAQSAPRQTGPETEAAFTVGLLHALHSLNGRRPSPRRLAWESMALAEEQGEVRSAAHVTAALGGLQSVEFLAANAFQARRVEISGQRERDLNAHLLLLALHPRPASPRGGAQQSAPPCPALRLAGLADEALSLLDSRRDLLGLGDLMHEAWRAADACAQGEEFPALRGLYATARQMGATGGRILGGSRLLLCAPPDAHADIARSLEGVTRIPFLFDPQGSRLLRFAPDADEAAPPLARIPFFAPNAEHATPLYAQAA